MLILKRTLSIDVEVSKKSSGRVEGAWGLCGHTHSAPPAPAWDVAKGRAAWAVRVLVDLAASRSVCFTDKSIMAQSVEFVRGLAPAARTAAGMPQRPRKRAFRDGRCNADLPWLSFSKIKIATPRANFFSF